MKRTTDGGIQDSRPEPGCFGRLKAKSGLVPSHKLRIVNRAMPGPTGHLQIDRHRYSANWKSTFRASVTRLDASSISSETKFPSLS